MKKYKKEKIYLLVAIIILTIIIIITFLYYFFVYTKSKNTIERVLDKSFDYLVSQASKMKAKTYEYDFTIDSKVNSSIDLSENAIDVINNLQNSLNMQVDLENKSIFLSNNATYKKDKLINSEFYSDIKKGASFLYLKDILNGSIYINDINDSTYLMIYQWLFMQNSSKIKTKKSMNIIKKEILESLKEEYCSEEKFDIEINGEKINSIKSTVKLSSQDFNNELKRILNALYENNSFLNCYKDKEEAKRYIRYVLDEINQISEKNTTLEINIYTKGFWQNDIIKIDINTYDENQENIKNIELTKLDKLNYLFKNYTKNESAIDGEIKINKEENKILLDINDGNNISLEIKYDKKKNVKVQNNIYLGDVRNEITELDERMIYANLVGTKLFEILDKEKMIVKFPSMTEEEIEAIRKLTQQNNTQSISVKSEAIAK